MMLFNGQPARLLPHDDYWEKPIKIGQRFPEKINYWFEGIVPGAVKVDDEGTVGCAGKTWNVRVRRASVFSDPASPTRSIVELEVIE